MLMKSWRQRLLLLLHQTGVEYAYLLVRVIYASFYSNAMTFFFFFQARLFHDWGMAWLNII